MSTMHRITPMHGTLATLHTLPVRMCRHSALAGLWSWLKAMHARQSQRLMLARLDDHMLSDIGVSRADAEREAAKKPWEE